ncbi:MAG: hypothetical protein J6R87_01250 [Rikenellaceae bacterium]|nr:hypothetical protein [Rikenellaceae bacterium]
MSNFVTLKIDNKPVDIDTQTRLTLSAVFDSTSAANTPKREVARLSLPATSTNRMVMGFAEQLATDSFNAAEHTLTVEIDNRVVASGVAVLSCVESEGEQVRYQIDVQSDLPSWRDAVGEKTIAELSFDFDTTINAEKVQESWREGEVAVRFLPVCRKAVNADMTGAEVTNVTKPLAADDYHPFLHLRSVVEQTFKDAGYTVESEFMASEEFRSLYMSGAFPDGDVEELERYMGFLARRAETATATADYAGCVYASPIYGSHTLGNPVDINTLNHWGDTYNKNGCLRLINGRMAWVPTREVSVGFIYELKYRTECRILSRERLTGFDKVWLDGATCHSFNITNPYVDHRDNPSAGFVYRLVVFGAQESDKFRVSYVLNGSSESKLLTGGNNEVIFGMAGDTVSIYRIERQLSTGSYEVWKNDWALYSGFVGQGGHMDISLTLRSTPQTVTPQTPKYLDELVFGGAKEGMTLRLEAGTSIRPVFYAYTVENAQVAWCDVAALDQPQVQIVDAVCDMFNLRIAEDSMRRVVKIEPADTFRSQGTTTDWAHKVEHNLKASISDIALTMPRKVKLAYSGSDSTIREHNEMTGEEFGVWSTEIAASRSKTPESEVVKLPFTPTLNIDGCFNEAPAAQVIKVGRTYADDVPSMERLNFPLKVVRYFGMKELPLGQRWGWPSYGGEYPYAAFHSPQEMFTLCFEDRDGVEGLNKHYTNSVRLWNKAKVLTAHLRLPQHEVAEVMDRTTRQDIISRKFTLGWDGDSDLYTLESIDKYSPEEGVVKCRFTKIN